MQVVVAGRSREEVTRVAGLATERSADVQTHLLANGHPDPLQGLAALPEVLVYCASREWRDELTALSERPVRPVTVVVAREMDPSMMRLAMRAGAREFLNAKDAEAELAGVLQSIEEEQLAAAHPHTGRIVAVIGAKGGVGTSTVAANLAYALAGKERRPLLVDLDVQTGDLGNLFDLPPSDGLLEALLRVDIIDQVAFGGYVVRHASGVSLLASSRDQSASGELPAAKLETLMRLAAATHPFVVVDLPRRVDQGTGTVLGMADDILLVMEQSVSHLRCAKRMAQMFASVGADLKKTTALVNRYDRAAAIVPRDVIEAVRVKDAFTLPNDFSLATRASDLGAPVLQTAPSSNLGRRMTELAEKMIGEKRPVDAGGGIARFLRKFKS
jgi:pilus assembly protein CpaE